MRIRQQLTLSFTSTVMLIIILFGTSVYYFSSRYRKNEFYIRMLDRVEIAEKMFLEKDKLPGDTYELIREQFLNKLPSETEEVFALPAEMDSLLHSYPQEFVEDLTKDDLAYLAVDGVQGVGKMFHFSNGDYAVVLTAQDIIGVRMLDYMRTIIIIAVAVCLVTVVAVSYILSARLINPITEKIKRANTISARNIHERLTVYDPENEVGELAIAFNNLLDRITKVFDSQRSFIHDASHEMRNPLTAIIGEAELALDKERTTSEYVESFKAIADEANRLNFLVNNLLQIATVNYEESAPSEHAIDLRALLLEVKEKFGFSMPDNRISMSLDTNTHTKDNLVIKGNSHLLQTAIMNFFDNACKFSGNKPVEVGLDVSDGYAEIVVVDHGIGIPESDIIKIRQPFHRAENVRHIPGSGIGIPLAVRIIELHGGSLDIQSQLNSGTTVKIRLPLVR